jgi:hypothetical protein
VAFGLFAEAQTLARPVFHGLLVPGGGLEFGYPALATVDAHRFASRGAEHVVLNLAMASGMSKAAGELAVAIPGVKG